MGWRELRVSDQRRGFVELASLEGANVSALCERFGISRQTGYVWLRRHAAGECDFEDRSRRPLRSPGRTTDDVEAAVLEVRDKHPAWGARKIAAVLRRRDEPVPAVSTVHAVLLRHGRVETEARRPQSYGRFEHEQPNQLWQMDFKGHFPLTDGVACHPLTIIDDHSRYLVGLRACANQRTTTVRGELEIILRHHGMPQAIYVDNGSPWGGGKPGQWTLLGVWLLKLGIRVIHGKPYHPQGRGKCERLHRSLVTEVVSMSPFASFQQVQDALDRWRSIYNRERPHEALGLDVPASRYRPSSRPFPEKLPEPAYDEGETLRVVPRTKQYIRFKGRWWPVPKAFAGELVAVRPEHRDGQYGVYFGSVPIASIDLNTP
jgi:transposase InsO family protein